MAPKRDLAKATQQRDNAEHKRSNGPLEAPPQREKKDIRKLGPLNAATKLQADAKAGKPDPGRSELTRPNGGEEQTTNGTFGFGRGGDGVPHTTRVSRKSTRGSVPGGEKHASQLTARQERKVSSPTARASRGK